MDCKNLRRLALLSISLFFLVGAAPSFAQTKKHPPSKPINLNTATISQLEELPGVGPVTARAILDFRAKSGPFHRVEDLLSIHRISQKKLSKLRPYVTVAPSAHPQSKPPQKRP
ncbi:MAG: helix-hairpin-helix domain-containing protein [Candidatus Acidiferrales bacterium]